ncbi:unnamed protein product [Agarophyton chilense]|eukprot:gb/GEZJ01003459.1/.p1 GENE.gb/GEZJ01003459.1/~~gb/GEZJ01003459.1/.p1  ORF type:complete len:134 (-),score=11.63 gb/GEZJ01003459.1/:239-640(-)
MKFTFTLIAVTLALTTLTQSTPLQRGLRRVPTWPFFTLPIFVTDASTATGGAGGNGGSANAVGAVVSGGFGGPAVSGSGFVANSGIIQGGAGVFSGNVANGAAGTVVGGGSITGSFTNSAVAGNGGAGGSASA